MRINDFASSCDELVIFRPDIQEQFYIIVDMPRGTKIQILGVTCFIVGLSSHDNLACRVWVRIGVFWVFIG